MAIQAGLAGKSDRVWVWLAAAGSSLMAVWRWARPTRPRSESVLDLYGWSWPFRAGLIGFATLGYGGRMESPALIAAGFAWLGICAADVRDLVRRWN
jgi:hypothetical protein